MTANIQDNSGTRLWKPEWSRAKGMWPIDLSQDPTLRKSFDLLRTKWSEVPFDIMDRAQTKQLRLVSDAQLLQLWDHAFASRAPLSESGWLHLIYKDVFRDKKVLDVGSGLGFDSIHYAKHGAKLTFVDIVPTNLEVVQRVCKIKGLSDVSFCYMEDLASLEQLPDDFDFIYAEGSLINAPLEMTQREMGALLQHLPVGGRVAMLGYPCVRWEREGGLPETEWGSKTDGGAPWMEWLDVSKLRYVFSPATFDVVMAFDFHDADFNWFDLMRTS